MLVWLMGLDLKYSVGLVSGLDLDLGMLLARRMEFGQMLVGLAFVWLMGCAGSTHPEFHIPGSSAVLRRVQLVQG